MANTTANEVQPGGVKVKNILKFIQDDPKAVEEIRLTLYRKAEINMIEIAVNFEESRKFAYRCPYVLKDSKDPRVPILYLLAGFDLLGEDKKVYLTHKEYPEQARVFGDSDSCHEAIPQIISDWFNMRPVMFALELNACVSKTYDFDTWAKNIFQKAEQIRDNAAEDAKISELWDLFIFEIEKCGLID